MRSVVVRWVIVLSIAPLSAYAQTGVVQGVGEPVSIYDLRFVRQQLRTLAPVVRLHKKEAEPAAPTVALDVRSGFGYIDGASGANTSYIPVDFALFIGSTEVGANLRATSSRVAGQSIDGMSDVGVRLLHTFEDENRSLTVGAIVHVPSGSAVSLGHSAHSLVGYYWQAIGSSPLSTVMTGVVSRVNASLPDGVSRYSHTLAARGVYSMHPGDTLQWPGKVYLELARVMRSGTSGTTGVTGAWTFPLRPKTVDAELALFRGLTKGARDTGIELVFAWHF